MVLFELPTILGICFGFYLWRWGRAHAVTGFIYYSAYYFNSNEQHRFANAIDSPVLYDVYRHLFNKRTKYHVYLRAVQSHYHTALEKKRKEMMQIVRIQAQTDGRYFLYATITVGLVAWSLSAALLFVFGFLLYLLARSGKFMIEDNVRDHTCTSVIVEEAIKMYRKEKRKIRQYERRQQAKNLQTT